MAIGSISDWAGQVGAGRSGIEECDGQQYKQLMHAGMLWLEQHIGAINALNVFPVPDGDTGTNMYLTMQAAWQEVANIADSSVATIAQGIAHGALMGARGNSGVILSQLFRGMAQALAHAHQMDAAGLAAALQQASATAYKAVIRPVEGTILTVARQAAQAGEEAASKGLSLPEVMRKVVQAAAQAVAETPSQLPVLAEAGVVDAGGQGLYVILEGMERCLRGEAVVATAILKGEETLAHAESLAGEYGYDVQFILQGTNLDVERIRADIDAMGESTLVVGDSNTVKVHVHTLEPGTPLNYGAALGSLSRIIVENLQEQYQEFVKNREPAPQAPVALPRSKPTPAGVAIIAVVAGEGLSRVYESLGATYIVPGGQTMNPSTEDLLKAMEATGAQKVILLPNNPNVILTAQQAQALSDRDVRVVPSRSIPQGIGALLAFNYQADLDTNLHNMSEALGAIRTGEVTQAIRSVRLNGIQVEQGQIIGLLDDQLVCAGDSYQSVVMELLEKMGASDLEIITLYYGQGISGEEARALAEAISTCYPGQEIEVVEGGQPYYAYLISGE